jgi:hypothetical protein
MTRLAAGCPDLAARSGAVLAGRPVPKPAAHAGGPETDFLPLDLAPGEVAAVAEALADLEIALAQADAPPPGALSSAAALHDRWRRAESCRSDAA